jgi:hypothetical protein
MWTAKIRKWVLCCLGWFLLYLYFQPNLLLTLYAWHLLFIPKMPRDAAYAELRALAAFYFACLAWYLVVNLAEEMRRLSNRRE